MPDGSRELRSDGALWRGTASWPNPPWTPGWPFGGEWAAPRPDPAILLAPIPDRPTLLVDPWRVLLMDPSDQSFVGIDGSRGQSGWLGRLVYAGRTPHTRGF